MASPLSDGDVFASTLAQRRRLEALCVRSEMLRTRGSMLRDEVQWLSQCIQHSYLKLIAAYTAMKHANTPAGHHFRPSGDPALQNTMPAKGAQPVAIETDLTDALLGATEILRTEFADTQGSGRETLERCERALCKARLPIRSIELPLY
jgi:hypothetical protein